MKPSAKKVVYLMIGAKGSGKTHIGNLLEQKLGIYFLRVEQRLIEHISALGAESDQLPNDGYDLELAWIDDILATNNAVIAEATGSSKYLPEYIRQLKSKYSLKLVRIVCPLDICFHRVKQRTNSNHFPVSDEMIKAINTATNNVELDWCLEIDNTKPALDSKVISAFKSIM